MRNPLQPFPSGSSTLPRARRPVFAGSVACALASLCACASLAKSPPPPAVRADLEIVECLLPGRIMQLGNTPFPSARRPTRTTAADCRLRGGEYVSYDRADYQTALRFWIAAAEQGDHEAQTNVGEIYERGVGSTPNYELAAAWYAKAAGQGDGRAQTALGLLYEQGLGVEKDPLKALDYYRRAAHLADNSVIYQSALDSALDQQRTALQKEINDLDSELKTTRELVTQLEAQSKAANRENSTLVANITALKATVARLDKDRDVGQQKLAAIPVRTPTAAKDVVVGTSAPPADVGGLKLGRFYALVIGNANYAHVEVLKTPISDAERVAKVLVDRYGFAVQTIEDANDYRMLEVLNEYAGKLTPDDNLLIYYAGHGARVGATGREFGYWLPVNADAPPNDVLWVSNEQVTAHLARLKAKRVLVVADSCYAGLLSGDPDVLLTAGIPPASRAFVEYKAPRVARQLISSGGDEPVLDEGGAGNSVFARAFIDILQTNAGILSVEGLYVELKSRVHAGAARTGFVQAPRYQPITRAGHAGGDFFFVPR